MSDPIVDPIVTASDIRACGLCLIPGARDWAKKYDIDWRDFLKNGLPASTLESKDAFGARVAAYVRAKQPVIDGATNG